jgi:hypothetical protein
MERLHGYTLDPFDPITAVCRADIPLLIEKRAGHYVSVNTVHRWMTRGVTVPGLTGPLILPSVRTGRGRFTMPQWLAVFLTLRDRPVFDPPRVDTPRQSSARHRRAMDRLRSMGVA